MIAEGNRRNIGETKNLIAAIVRGFIADVLESHSGMIPHRT
jgi:hypothetical protein